MVIATRPPVGQRPVPRPDHLRVELAAIVGSVNVIVDAAELTVFEYDGIGLSGRPDAVVFPRSAGEVQAVVRLAGRYGLPVTPRGAGTGLSGGALAINGGILLVLTKMNRILEVDVENGWAIVEPGVVNLDLSTAIAGDGQFYAPDPSSQKACTLGGNVAENSGGPHCLAYGVTTNHVLMLEVVLADGSLARLGALAPDPIGYDLRGLFIGSEGTLGIVTRIWVRILPLPPAVLTMVAAFASTELACRAVSQTIATGLVPAALEIIDAVTIEAVNASIGAGYPAEAGAVLLVEVDGTAEQVADEGARVADVCRSVGALSIESAQSAEARERLWAGRKGALGALGRLAPNYVLQDGVVPRSKLPEILRVVEAMATRYQLRIANVFHAGDGNLHPCILFDARDSDVLGRVELCNKAIMRACVDAGGTITGEHGVGTDKSVYMDWIFTERDLALMASVRDAWNPLGLFNPGKILPAGASCFKTPGSLDGYL